jgi:hypothetical protein
MELLLTSTAGRMCNLTMHLNFTIGSMQKKEAPVSF